MVEMGTAVGTLKVGNMPSSYLTFDRLATISFCGSYAGPVLGYALGGFLVEKYGAYSILSPFYVSCTLNFIWLGVFVLSAHDTPASHPTILQEERDYIERTIGDKVTFCALVHDQYSSLVDEKLHKRVIFQLPLEVILHLNACLGDHCSQFLQELDFLHANHFTVKGMVKIKTFLINHSSNNFFEPVEQFLEDILGLGPSEAGIIGSLPHLVMAIVVPCGGVLADRLRVKKILSPTNVRKVMNCGGFGTEAFFLLVLSYTKTRIENVAALIIAVGSSGLAISGNFRVIQGLF